MGSAAPGTCVESPPHSPGPVSSETRLSELSPGRASWCSPRGQAPRTQQAAPGRRAPVLVSRLLSARSRPSARALGQPAWGAHAPRSRHRSLLGPHGDGRRRGPSDPSPEEASVSRTGVHGRRLCPRRGPASVVTVDRPICTQQVQRGSLGALLSKRGPAAWGCPSLHTSPSTAWPGTHPGLTPTPAPSAHLKPIPSRGRPKPISIFSGLHSIWVLDTNEGDTKTAGPMPTPQPLAGTKSKGPGWAVNSGGSWPPVPMPLSLVPQSPLSTGSGKAQSSL